MQKVKWKPSNLEIIDKKTEQKIEELVKKLREISDDLSEVESEIKDLLDEDFIDEDDREEIIDVFIKLI